MNMQLYRAALVALMVTGSIQTTYVEQHSATALALKLLHEEWQEASEESILREFQKPAQERQHGVISKETRDEKGALFKGAIVAADKRGPSYSGKKYIWIILTKEFIDPKERVNPSEAYNSYFDKAKWSQQCKDRYTKCKKSGYVDVTGRLRQKVTCRTYGRLELLGAMASR